jgi:hypothetical protein
MHSAIISYTKPAIVGSNPTVMLALRGEVVNTPVQEKRILFNQNAVHYTTTVV